MRQTIWTVVRRGLLDGPVIAFTTQAAAEAYIRHIEPAASRAGMVVTCIDLCDAADLPVCLAGPNGRKETYARLLEQEGVL